MTTKPFDPKADWFSPSQAMRISTQSFDEGWRRALESVRFAHRNLTKTEFTRYLDRLIEASERTTNHAPRYAEP